MIRTRFAPSPTGVLHIGSVRTALFCWLYARHCGGKYVLRIEDTDRARSTPENIAAIFEGLSWLGIDSDEEPVYQSRRLQRYKQVLAEWLASEDAYYCYCTKEELSALREKQKLDGVKTRYDGRCRSRTEPRPGVDPVVRFRNPLEGTVVIDDLVHGQVEFRNEELDDLVIARSDGSPTYNFTVVIDDYDMEISHVIRGDDHLNNTPRQHHMLHALGVGPPQYAHLPMILGADGAKLSKRHGAVDIRDYREQGYLPEALLNYLVRLGWSHGDQEIFSVQEMIDLFDIRHINLSAAAFNPEKLKWLNQQHIIAMPADELGLRLVPFLEQLGLDPNNGPDPAAVADGFRERAETLAIMAQNCRYCYEDFDSPDPKAAKKHLRPAIRDPLQTACDRLQAISAWTPSSISKVIEESAAQYEINMGKLGQPVRVAVTGGSVSPPIDVTLALVGQARTIERLKKALEFVEARIGMSGA